MREVDLAVERARKIERVHRVLRVDRTAGRLSRLEAVAARARERGCVLDRRLRVVLLLHSCVGTEATGREDHGSPCPDRLALVADINDGAFDAAVALHQLDQFRAVFDRHATLAQAVIKSPDQRVAHHQPRAALEAQAVGGVAKQQFRRGHEVRDRGDRFQQKRNVELSDHHAAEHHERRDRRPHAIEVLTQQPPVEWQRRERAACERTPRLVRVIVRVHRRRDEFHFRAPVQIVERRGSRRQERLAHCLGARADFGIEETPRVVDLVRHAVAHRLARPRNPDRPGGGRCRAADLIGLLAEEHVEAFERGKQGRAHAAHAGAKDQDIDLAVPTHALTYSAHARESGHFAALIA